MFKEFIVSDVFGKSFLGKYHNPNDLVFDVAGHPYICASNSNNGINKDMPRVTGKSLYLTPDKIIAWGKQCPMFCYHDEPCVTSQGMYYLDMTNYDEKVCLYVCGVLTKSCADKYNYTNCLIGKILDEEIISLPVISHHAPSHKYTIEDIDWQYMRERIEELERERIEELERERIEELDAYLKAADLNDYELNDEDKAVLCISDEKYIKEYVGDVIWKKVKIGDVLCVKSPKKKFNANELIFDGSHPYVARGSSNNGVKGYISEDEQFLNEGNTISFGQDTATVFYQREPYFAGDKIKIISLKDDTFDEKIGEYFVEVIRKAFSSFSWGVSSFNEDVINNTEIELPFDSDGNLHKLYIYIYSSYRKNSYQRNDSLERPSVRDIARNCMRFGLFKLEQLFESQTGDVDLQQKDINNKGYFFINSGIENRGVKGKTDRPAKVFKAGTITIDFWGNAYYRDFDYVMATHNHVFSLSGDVIKNEKVGHYIIGKLSKLPKLFSYNNMATWNKLKVLDISLPIKFDASDDYNIDDIDFEYMEKYIRAIEKVVIKDVVVWKDIVIEETKKVVEQA